MFPLTIRGNRAALVPFGGIIRPFHAYLMELEQLALTAPDGQVLDNPRAIQAMATRTPGRINLRVNPGTPVGWTDVASTGCSAIARMNWLAVFG